MKKLFASYILGILSFVLSLTGIFSLFLSIPGLILAITSLKIREKRINIPIGYRVRVERKNLSVKPFMTTRYFSYIAIGLNIFSIVVSLFATAIVVALFTAGSR